MPSEHREKAVEAAKRAVMKPVTGSDPVTEALEAAERDLQRMYFERFREAVLSEEGRQAAYAAVRDVGRRREHHSPMPDGLTTSAHARAAVDAALTKAQEIMEEGGDRG